MSVTYKSAMTLNLKAKVKTKGPWAAFHEQLSEKDQRIAELQAQVGVCMSTVLQWTLH